MQHLQSTDRCSLHARRSPHDLPLPSSFQISDIPNMHATRRITQAGCWPPLASEAPPATSGELRLRSGGGGLGTPGSPGTDSPGARARHLPVIMAVPGPMSAWAGTRRRPRYLKTTAGGCPSGTRRPCPSAGASKPVHTALPNGPCNGHATALVQTHTYSCVTACEIKRS